MTIKDKFQYIRDYIDSENICDMIQEFLEDEQLIKFCEFLEDEFDIEYDNNYIDLDDDL